MGSLTSNSLALVSIDSGFSEVLVNIFTQDWRVGEHLKHLIMFKVFSQKVALKHAPVFKTTKLVLMLKQFVTQPGN